MAHRGGLGGLPVRTVAARSSDRSPQLLQECFQVGFGSGVCWSSYDTKVTLVVNDAFFPYTESCTC